MQKKEEEEWQSHVKLEFQCLKFYCSLAIFWLGTHKTKDNQSMLLHDIVVNNMENLLRQGGGQGSGNYVVKTILTD